MKKKLLSFAAFCVRITFIVSVVFFIQALAVNNYDEVLQMSKVSEPITCWLYWLGAGVLCGICVVQVNKTFSV